MKLKTWIINVRTSSKPDLEDQLMSRSFFWRRRKVLEIRKTFVFLQAILKFQNSEKLNRTVSKKDFDLCDKYWDFVRHVSKWNVLDSPFGFFCKQNLQSGLLSEEYIVCKLSSQFLWFDGSSSFRWTVFGGFRYSSKCKTLKFQNLKSNRKSAI